MNLVIAGGRDFNDMAGLCSVVDEYVRGRGAVTVFCGMARGADMCGHDYALLRGYPVRKFPANWTDHGKRAGHLRNELMAQVCSHVIVFWDGKSPGTKSMIAFAQQYNKPCKIVRYESQREAESKMADKVSGVIKVVKKNDFGFYSVKIDDTWYGTGQKKDPGVAAGDVVEGEYELEKGKYKTITKSGLTKATKAAPTGAAAGAGGGDRMSKGEWAQKDQRIQYQHAQKVAVTILALPAVQELINKAKPADKVGVLESLFDKYTASVFEDVATFGAVLRANGTTTDKDPAAPPAEDDDE